MIDKDKFLSRVEPTTESGCWIWSGATLKGGYGICYDGVKSVTAHRLSYRLFKGEIPSDKMVLHTCDVRCCVNPNHLYLGSHSDNMKDRSDRGRTASGHKTTSYMGVGHHKAKLCENDVRFIKASDFTQTKLAEMFSVSIAAIGYIKTGRNWKHIT
jgi:hypothetical protein